MQGDILAKLLYAEVDQHEIEILGGLAVLQRCIPDVAERAEWLKETLVLYVARMRGSDYSDSMVYGLHAYHVTDEGDQRAIIEFFETLVAPCK